MSVSVACLVGELPCSSSKFYLFKLSDNNEAQHWRYDVTNAITMQERIFRKEILLSQNIHVYLETEQGINKEFRKQVFFKMNSSLGSFLLHYNGDERVSVP